MDLVRRFSLKLPLIGAPLAGGPSTPRLTAALCEAGALGSLGAAYLAPDQIESEAAEVRARTSRPFAINLFIPGPEAVFSDARREAALAATAPYRRELGLPEPRLAPPYTEDFDRQFERVLRIKPAVLSFVFGLLDPEHAEACRQAGIFMLGTATTPEEAKALEASGADGVVLQGVEAGGHRGIFDPAAEEPGIHAFDLLDRCVRETNLPLIVAGGLRTGADLRRAVARGAQAAQLGTAFLLCDEAGTSAPYRRVLSEAKTPTRLTRAFSGRWARGIENRFLLEMEGRGEAILPFPAQNVFTRDLRRASAAQDLPDFLSLWAGVGTEKIRTGPAAEIVADLQREFAS